MKKLKVILSLVLTLSIIFLNSPVWGQAREIKKGDPAPEDGIFYTIDSHASLVAKIQGLDMRCTAEKEHLTKTLELKYKLDLSKLQISNETLEKQLKITEQLHLDSKKLLMDQFKEQQASPWYKSNQFNFWLGFGIASVVYGLASWGFYEMGRRTSN